MPVKQIQLRGISRTPSDRMIADGGVAESLNVFIDNTESAPALLPNDITAAEGLPTDKKYDVLFIHKGNGYTNYICQYEMNDYSATAYIVGATDVRRIVEQAEYLANDYASYYHSVKGKFLPISVINRFKNALSDFQENPRVLLPGITFHSHKERDEFIGGWQAGDEVQLTYEYEETGSEAKGIGVWDNGEFKPFLSLAEGEVFKLMTSVGNTLIISTSSHTWYSLYRGGEYINLGTSIPMPRIRFSMVECESKLPPDPWHTRAIYDYHIDEKTGYQSWNTKYEKEEELDSKIYDLLCEKIIEDDRHMSDNGVYSYPVFINFGVELYDGSKHCVMPIMMGAGISSPYQIMATSTDCMFEPQYERSFINFARTNAYKIAYTIESLPDNWELWKDLIANISFYVSAPIGQSLPYGKAAQATLVDTIEWEVGASSGIPHVARASIYEITLGSKKDRMETLIEQNNALYVLKSFTFEELTKVKLNTTTEINSKNKILQDEIVSEKTLLKDYELSEPEYQYTDVRSINNRLLAYGVHEKITTDSYHLPCISTNIAARSQWKFVCYYNYGSLASLIGKQYAFNYPKHIEEGYTIEFRFVVIKGDAKVVVLNNAVSVNSLGGNNDTYAFITCPYVNATHVQVEIRKDAGGTFYKTFQLKPLGSSPMSYYYGDLAEPLFSACEQESENTPLELTSPWINRTDTIILSNVDSPFYFPISKMQTYPSPVIGIGAVTKPLSQGQFGEFELYIFTEGGVYVVAIDPDGSLGKKRIVSGEVAIPGTITSLEQGVLFATDKGLMSIVGSDVTNLSPDMNGKHYVLEESVAKALSRDDNWKDLVPILQDSTPFMDFVRTSSSMFDYANSRIIMVSSEDPGYHYLLKLDTNTWHKLSSDVVIKRILNSFPKAYAQVELADGTTALYDYSPELSNIKAQTGKGVIITRPFDLGETDVRKSINRLLVRGDFAKAHVQLILLGSMDGRKFTWIPARHGSSWKCFRAMLLLDLDKYERVSYLDIEYDSRFINKLR